MASSTAALAGSAGLSLFGNRVAMGQASNAAEVVAGKDRRLMVHKADIAVLETPPELLNSQITPLDVLFVRNNGQPIDAASVNGVPLDGWNVEFVGAINGKKSISGKDLLEMPMKSHEMVLQCCGNGRALFANSVQAKGTQWLRGGMGNVEIKGVPLSYVLEKLGVRINAEATYLTAEGNEPAAPGKEEFEHSLPLADVLSRSVLALEMNGRPIPQCHGGPLRLMTPGYFGTMHIKWLRRLRFEANESQNYNHTSRYRAPHQIIEPGTAFKYNVENSRPCWRLKLKSVVLSPAPGATWRSNQASTVRGVAFNDGQAPIENVLVSTDRGQSWSRVKLETPDSAFAWYRWSHDLKLPAGEHEIWTRAVDRLGRSQPIDGSIHWNPSGYEWNGVEKISVQVV
jgi:sulfite oxidase